MTFSSRAVQRLLQSSCAVIAQIPPASEEEGALMWSCEPVYALCTSVGSLMVHLSRPHDAVSFLQSVKVRPLCMQA